MSEHPRASWSAPLVRARPRPLRAAVLSALIPGTGQIAAGHRRRGGWMLAGVLLASGVLAGLSVALAAAGVDQALGALVRTETLALIVGVNVVVALARLAAAADAWRIARLPGRPGLRGLGAVAAVLAVLVVAPHVGIGIAAAEAQRVVDAVLAPSSPAGTVDDRPELDPPLEEAAPQPTPTPLLEAPDPAAPAGPGDPDAVVPDGSGEGRAAPLLDGAERLTVLLLGSDAGPDRTGARVDVMVVASMDIEDGRVSLISVPRNLAEVPMPPGLLADRLGARYPRRLMSLYPEASADPVLSEAYDDPGRAAIAGAVSALLELPIDHVAMVDMGGFVHVVDALGGVEVDVDRPIRVRLSPAFDGDAPRTFDIPSGRQALDGQQALAYVRTREGTDDYDRMRRQRCLVGAVVRDTEPLGLLRAVPRLADVVAERVRTDVPADRLPDLARLAYRADLDGLATLGVTPPAHTAGRNADGFLTPDLDRIRRDVAGLMEAEAVASAEDLDSTCR